MPSDFTYDAGPNVATKSNLVGLPAGADASKYLAASDVNILSGAAGSLRDAIIQGRYHGLTSTPDAPVSVAGGVSLRANDGDLEISLDGSDYESLFGIIIGDSASKVDGHGNGAVNRVALWSDANTVSSDSGLTYASGVLFSKNSLGTDALKLQQSAVHEATRFSLLQPGGGPTDYRLTVGVRDNFVGTPQDASLFFQSDGTYPFKFFMGDTNVFSVDQDGICKVAGYLGVNGMTGDSTFPLNVGGAVIANNVANGAAYGLTMSNGIDSTWSVIPVGSGQVRMKNDDAGRWMSIADGDGSVDAFAVRGGHVIIGDATCADDGVHALQVTGSGIFTSTLAASNLSGTNTGDSTIGTFGSSPTANGASASGSVITLQPADATHPGAVTTGTQSFAGAKTFTGTLNGSGQVLIGTPVTTDAQVAIKVRGSNTAGLYLEGTGGVAQPVIRFKHDTDSDYVQLVGGGTAGFLFQAAGTAEVVSILPASGLKVREGKYVSLNLGTDTAKILSDASTHILKYFSAAADGSSAVAHAFDTSVAFNNATAKLVSGRNNGTEKFFFDKDGHLLIGSAISLSGLDVGAAGPIVGSFQNTVDAYSTPPQSGIGFTVKADSGGTIAYMGQIIAGKLSAGDPTSGSNVNKKGFVDCYASGPLWTNIQVWRAVSDGAGSSRFLVNTTTDDGSSSLQVVGAATFTGGVAIGNDSSLVASKKLRLDGPAGTRYLIYNSGTAEVQLFTANGFSVDGAMKGQQTLQIGGSTASYMDFVGGDATKFTLTARGGTDVGISLVTQGVGAVSVTEGTKYSLNGTTATSYIKGDASTHGLEISSNVTNSSSNYAYSFLAPNGTALNAQVFRFRFGSTTFFEQQNDGSLIVGDGTHAPYIASRNTVLILAGTANDGATAKGVILNCQNAFTTSGAKIVSVTNSNTEVHAIDLYGKEVHTNVSGKARSGVATLSGGTVTVTTASVKTASKIRLSHQGTGTVANFGIPYVGTITNSTSFVINSTNALDDDVILWEIIEVA